LDMDRRIIDYQQDEGFGYQEMRDDGQLKIATYNVLFTARNKFLRWLLAPNTRYQNQIDAILPEINADIICLQEVRKEYLEMLNKSMIKDQYQISAYEVGRADKHFPIILSKIPFTELLMRDRTLYALFEWKKTPFIVVNVHLNMLGRNKRMRAHEVRNIEQTLRSISESADNEEQRQQIQKALDSDNIFVMGDFNMHKPLENLTFEEFEYSDVWLEKHSHLQGHTFDGTTNKLLRTMSPFDNRRLRLDRIILKTKSNFAPKDIQIFGDRQIQTTWSERWLPLFPSDHYGLISSFELRDSPRPNPFALPFYKEFKALPQNRTGYRNGAMIILYSFTAFLAISVVLVFGSYKLIKFVGKLF